MFEFCEKSWTSIWALPGSLGDRIRGIVFFLLVLSLLFLVVGIAVTVLRQRASDRGAPVVTQPGFNWDFLEQSVEYLPVSAGSSVILSLLLGLLGLAPALRWAGAAAALPALLVLLQYVYVLAHRPSEASDSDEIESQSKRAHKAVESAYGTRTLFIRYGFPAIVLLVEGLVLVLALVQPERFIKVPHGELIVGAVYGAMGAYTWVMLELGRRGFRHDITGGLALWAIVTLALGPVLAAVLAFVWKMNPTDGNAWQPAVVLFYAGYAPRTVLTAVTSAAGQLLRVGPSPHVETRTTPLTKIRGINTQIEERLAEEGIDNVETLATAEPIRLLRDTPFDLRAILWWIDEALLMMYLPQRWQMLQEQGITGAIDLADLAKKVHATTRRPQVTAVNALVKPEAVTDAGGTDPAPQSVLCSPEAVLKAIAERINLGESEFCALIERIRQDSQVQYVWWLYNVYVSDGDKASEKKSDSSDAGKTDKPSPESSAPPPESSAT